MKLKRHFLQYICLFFAAVLLASCEFESKTTPDSSDVVHLRISVDGVQKSVARDINPQDPLPDLTNIVFTGTPAGSASPALNETADTLTALLAKDMTVKPGIWTFKLTAKIGGADYEDEVTQAITQTECAIAFTLHLATGSVQNGGLSISINFSGNATKVTAVLQTSDGTQTGTEENLTVSDAESGDYIVRYAKDAETDGIPQGTYTVVIKFYGGETEKTSDGNLLLLNTYREFVNIMPGLTSSATRTLDLNEVYTITYHDFDENGETTTADASVFTGSAPSQFSRKSTITLPAAAKEDWIFDGWYTDSSCTAGNEISQVTKCAANLQLYPKWTEPYAKVADSYFRTLSDTLTAINEATGEIAIKLYSLATQEEIGDYRTNGTISKTIYARNSDSTVKGISLDMEKATSITALNSNAFSSCSKLSSVMLPSSLTSIGERAFYYCTKLKGISIPASVTSIEKYAFFNSGLTSVTFIDWDDDYRWKVNESICLSLADIHDSEKMAIYLTKDYYSYNYLDYYSCTWEKTKAAELPFKMKEGKNIDSVMKELTSDITTASFTASETPPDGPVSYYLDVAEYYVPVWLSDTTIYYYSAGYTDSNKKIPLNSDCSRMFTNCTCLTSVDLTGFDTSAVTTMDFMFSGCSSLKTIDLTGFDTSAVTTMNGMFSGCSALTEIDLTGLNTATVTTMASLFSNCLKLTSITGLAGLNTSEVTTMQNMFYGCSSLTALDMTNFNTKKVTAMDSMFRGCSSLDTLDVTSFDTKNVTTMKSMFFDCSKLTSIAGLTGLDTSAVTTMESLFYRCKSYTSIDLKGLNTSSVSSMKEMFYGCSALTSVDMTGLDISSVETMDGMFYGCSSLTSVGGLTGLNTSAVKTMENMFSGCTSLTSLDLSGLDTSSVSLMSSMFSRCSNLTSLTLTGFNTSAATYMGDMFSDCSSLTTLDLSSFDTSSVTWMASMFSGCSALKTILVSDTFVTTKVSASSYMFKACTSLVGGAGTTYNASYMDATYAHIDGGTANPGYFTSANIADVSVSVSISGDISVTQAQEGGNITLTAASGFTDYTWTSDPVITGATESSDKTVYTIPTAELESGYAYTILLTATRKGIPYSTEATVVSEATAQLNATAAEQISALTESGTVTVYGNVTSSDITSIASALKAKASEDNSIKVSLDLSAAQGLESIPSNAFSGCTSLESIDIPDSVTSLGNGVFSGCASLKNLDIPDGVTSLGEYVFQNCKLLKSIVLPASLTSIAYYAFNGCAALTSATFINTSGWKAGETTLESSALADTATAASYLTSYYGSSAWTRSE